MYYLFQLLKSLFKSCGAPNTMNFIEQTFKTGCSAEMTIGWIHVKHIFVCIRSFVKFSSMDPEVQADSKSCVMQMFLVLPGWSVLVLDISFLIAR